MLVQMFIERWHVWSLFAVDKLDVIGRRSETSNLDE